MFFQVQYLISRLFCFYSLLMSFIIIINTKLMNYFFSKDQTHQYHIQLFRPSKKASFREEWHSQYQLKLKTANSTNFQAKKKRIDFGHAATSNSDEITLNSPSKLNPQSTIKLISDSSMYNKQFQIIGSRKIKHHQMQGFMMKKHLNVESESVETSEVVLRMIKKSQYGQIIKRKALKKWNDEQFTQQKQYYSQQQDKTYPLSWKGIDYLDTIQKDKKCNFIVKPIQLTNILQGKVGDCYFLSALAALTNPNRPERILKLFPSFQTNDQGIYMARLMLKGILQEVVVDEYFPVYKQQDELKLLGCRPCKKDKQIYTLVLEKCWAKLFKSYQNIDGGYAHQALHALTGALTRLYSIDDETITEQLDINFFSQILQFHANQYVLCAGTSQSLIQIVTIDGYKTKIAIPKNHVFSIVEITKINDQKTLKIYNPWGHNLDAQNNHKNGQFIIGWKEFKKIFGNLTVCKLHDNANYLFAQLNFQSNKLKFIELTIYQDKTGYFAITVSETFVKKENHQYLNVTYIVLKNTDRQQFQMVNQIRSQYKYSDHYLELHDLKKGKYLIAIFITNPQINQPLTFGVYSEDSFGFVEKTFNKDFSDNFIPKVLLGYDKKKRQEKLKPDNRIYPELSKDIWFSFRMMKRSRLGYILLHVGKDTKQYELQFRHKSFEQMGLVFMHPYNQQVNKLTAKPGFQSIATIVVQNVDLFNEKYEQNIQFIYQQIKQNCHQA